MEDFEDNVSVIEEQFIKATSFLPSILEKLDTKTKLLFYGFYKQATVGICNIPKPGFFSIEAKSKWYAWNSLGIMDKIEAMKQYVELMDQIDPCWYENKIRGSVFVSRPIFDDEKIPESEKSVFDIVKDGNLTKLKQIFIQDKTIIHTNDEEGMTLLHWAADRGFTEIVEFLLDSGSDVNKLDSLNQTALIYGAAANHYEIVRTLLKFKPNLELKDEDGLTAFELTTDERIKKILS